MRCKVILGLFVLTLLALADGGKILFYTPFCSKSIKITFMPLAKALAKRGHQVTVVMPFEEKEKLPNLEVITVKSDFDELTRTMSKRILADDPGATPPFGVMMASAVDSNENALTHPAMRKYLEDENTVFDVTIVLPFLANEVGFFLAHRFKSAQVQYFTGQVSASTMDFSMGQPHNPAYLPFLMFQYTHPMTFPKRILNTVATWLLHYGARNMYIHSQVNGILDKHIPGNPERPSLLELERNTSLALHFGHPFIMDGMRPVVPNFEFVGMMNCKAAEPLPTDLKKYVDGAKDGLIYVSFGSVLQASEMSDETRLLMLNVFKQFPKQRFLWKWETEQMPGLPDNVKLSKWLPQQDILAHANTKLFITHGGQSSSQEALCHEKPTVVVSVFGDQHANGNEAERVGNGIWIPWYTLTQDKLYEAVKAVLTQPQYLEKAKEQGSLVKDQIVPPLERAIWRIEFLMRHKGRNFYKSPVHDLYWFQYYLIDVYVTLLAIIFIVVLVFKKLIQCLCCRSKSSTSSRPSQKTGRKKRD